MSEPVVQRASGEQDDDGLSSAILSAYAKVLTWSFGATLILIGGMLALIYPQIDKPVNEGHGYLMEMVVMLGALGAFFSALIRLYSYKDLPKALVVSSLRGLSGLHLAVYSLVPPVVGAISAAVIFLLFAAGIVEGGALFPKFACGDDGGAIDKCRSFRGMISDWGPDGPADYAKALIWGFVAGFAERLVPDTLRGLAKRYPSQPDTPAPAAPPAKQEDAGAASAPDKDAKAKAKSKKE